MAGCDQDDRLLCLFLLPFLLGELVILITAIVFPRVSALQKQIPLSQYFARVAWLHPHQCPRRL